MTKILIIEDEIPISDLIKLNLEMAGFETEQAMDGEEGLQYINECQPHLVILDIMIPKISGFELLPQLINRDIPVIILTAKDNLMDKVNGLNMGADDYITKPFEAVELIARINAILRRNERKKTERKDSFSLFKVDDIEICFKSRKVFKMEEEIELTPKEFALLKLFIENKGIALSRDVLLQKVWGFDYIGNTRTIDMHIQKLRRKLDLNAIKTVYKYGYRFEV